MPLKKGESWNFCGAPTSSPLPQVLHFSHHPAVYTRARMTRRCWGSVAAAPTTPTAGRRWRWTGGTRSTRRTKVLLALCTTGGGRWRSCFNDCCWRRCRREITILHNLVSWFGRINVGFGNGGSNSTRWTWRGGRRRWLLLLLWLVMMVVRRYRVLMIWLCSFTSAWRRTRKFGWLNDLLGSTGMRRCSGYCCRPWNDWWVGWRRCGRDWITASHLFGFILTFFKRNVKLNFFFFWRVRVVRLFFLNFHKFRTFPLHILLEPLFAWVFTSCSWGRRWWGNHTLIPVTVFFQSVENVLCVRVDKVSPRFPQWVDDVVNKANLSSAKYHGNKFSVLLLS